MSDVLEAALRCAAIGLHVFPAPPGQRKSYKSSAFSHGRRWGATDDPREIEKDWGKWPDACLGIACGPLSNLLVIDIDGPSHGFDGFASWAALEAGHGGIPETVEVDTPSGGRHVYFRWPYGRPIVNSAGLVGPGIDVRAEGGMVIAPPSAKPGSGRYAWRSSPEVGLADAPGWLLDLCEKPPAPPPPRAIPPVSDAWARRALEAEVSSVLTAPEGQRNDHLNRAAFNLGQIVGGGGLDQDVAQVALERAAAGAGLAVGEIRPTVRSGLSAGLKSPRGPKERPLPVEITPYRNGAAVAQLADYDDPALDTLSGPAGTMPDVSHLANGVLAEVYRHVREAMRRDWPEAAFVVALNVVGVCIGRNFATWTNVRSNLYTVVLAKSGWGKSSIYGPAVDLMIHAGLKDMIGAERIMSDSGLIQEVYGHPEHKKIYFLDEFGHMLQRCNDRGAGGHVRKIVTEFTNLYSKAQGFYAGSAYAGGSSFSMECPQINIFGMATPRQFWEAFGSGAIEDGTLPRFSILKAGGRPARREQDAGHLDRVAASRDVLAPKVRRLSSLRRTVSGNMGNAPGAMPDVIRVMPSPEAEEAWKAVERAAERIADESEARRPDHDLGGILARTAETAAKIALIFAVSRNPDAPRIEIGDMVAGRRLAWWFAHVAIEGATIHVADSPQQAMRQRVLEFIRTGEGASRSRRDVCRKFTMTLRDLEDALKGLVESELIAPSEAPQSGKEGGRPSLIYTALSG